MMDIALKMIELNTLNKEASILVQKIASILTGPEIPTILRYKDLESLDEYAAFQAADKVRVQKLPMLNGLYFLTEMEAGAILSAHYHDAHEIIWVESGTLVDLISGEAWTRGHQATFRAGQAHKLSSPGGCRIYTQLIR